MRRWIAISIVLGVAALQPAPRCLGLDAVEGSLLERTRWVQFDLVLGRLTATYVNGGKGRRVRPPTDRAPHEALAISAHSKSGIRTIRYELQKPDWHVLLEVVNRDNVQLTSTRRNPDGAERMLRVVQRPDQPIEIVWRHEKNERRLRLPSFWHLLLIEPELAEAELLPVFKLIRSDWNIANNTGSVRTKLADTAATAVPIGPATISELVAQLDAPSHLDRRAAFRELRGFGVEVLPLLRQFRTESLSPEQQLRLVKIRDSLDAGSPDSPQRVALWMLNDVTVWVALLESPQLDVRRVAYTRLEQLSEQPLEFDPTAPGSIRQEQVARLRGSFVR